MDNIFGNQGGVGADIRVDSETDEQKKRLLKARLESLKAELPSARQRSDYGAAQTELWGLGEYAPPLAPDRPLVTEVPAVPAVPDALNRPPNRQRSQGSGMNWVFGAPSGTPAPNAPGLDINRESPAPASFNPFDRDTRNELYAGALEANARRNNGTAPPSNGLASAGTSAALVDSVIGSAFSSLGRSTQMPQRGYDPVVDAFASDPYGSEDALAKQLASTLMGERIEGGGWFSPMMKLKQVAYGNAGQIGDYMKYLATVQGGNDRLENAGRMLSALGKGARGAATTAAERGEIVPPEGAGAIRKAIIGIQNSVLNDDWWTYTVAENLGRMLPLMVATAVLPEGLVARGAIAGGGRGIALLETLFPAAMKFINSATAPVIDSIAVKLGTEYAGSKVVNAVSKRAVGAAAKGLSTNLEYNFVSAVTESVAEAAEANDRMRREGASFEDANRESGRVFGQGIVGLMGTEAAEDFLGNFLMPKAVSRIFNASSPKAKKSFMRTISRETTEAGIKFAFNVYKEMTEEMLQETIQQNLGGSLSKNLAIGATPYGLQTNDDIREAGEGGAKFALGFGITGKANLRTIRQAQQFLQGLKNTSDINTAVFSSGGVVNTTPEIIVANTIDLTDATIDLRTQRELSEPGLTEDQKALKIQAGFELKQRARELFGVNEAFDTAATPKTRMEKWEYAWNQNRANEFLNTIRFMHPDGPMGFEMLVNERQQELARAASEADKFGTDQGSVAQQYGNEQRAEINGVPVVDPANALTKEQFDRVLAQPYMSEAAELVSGISKDIASAFAEARQQVTDGKETSVLAKLIVMLKDRGLYDDRVDADGNPIVGDLFKPVQIMLANQSMGFQRGNQTAVGPHAIYNQEIIKLQMRWDANQNGEQTRSTREEFVNSNIKENFQKELVSTVAHELGHVINFLMLMRDLVTTIFMMITFVLF